MKAEGLGLIKIYCTGCNKNMKGISYCILYNKTLMEEITYLE